MSADRALAIAERIVRQVLRDRRTLGLIVVAPLVVMSLVGYSLGDQRGVLDRVAPALLAVFAMFFTFVLTGVSFLRERAQGTLDRLRTTPVRTGEILVGYLLGFMLFASLQSMLILLFTIGAFRIDYRGDLWLAVALLMLLTLVAVSLGIFVSTFARNEFQVVQFIPIVLAPQIFLSGVIVPVAHMPPVLGAISRVLPLTYAVRGLGDIMLMGEGVRGVLPEAGVLAAFGVALLVAAAATVRRS